MANNIQTDPMYLDTALAPINTGRTLNIFKSVEWVNPGATEDRAYLYDNNGQVVCDFRCTIPQQNQSKWFGSKGQPFDGPLTLAQLDSGYLLVTRL